LNEGITLGPCLTFYVTGCERPLELSERPIAIVLQQVGEASGPAATKLVRDALRSGSASAPNVHQLYSRMFAVSAGVDFAVNPGSATATPSFASSRILSTLLTFARSRGNARICYSLLFTEDKFCPAVMLWVSAEPGSDCELPIRHPEFRSTANRQ